MVKQRSERDEIPPHFGTVNFERRRQPRISTDLPAEYWHIEGSKNHNGRLLNASEGGFLLYLPERIGVGQNLKVRLFIGAIDRLKPIDAFVQVVWNDLHFRENGYYRIGVRFVHISQENMDRLKDYLNTLIHLEDLSESNISSKLPKDLDFSNPDDLPLAFPKASDRE